MLKYSRKYCKINPFHLVCKNTYSVQYQSALFNRPSQNGQLQTNLLTDNSFFLISYMILTFQKGPYHPSFVESDTQISF